MAGEELQPPRPLPWYPRKLAWQMDASRAQLRKLDALAAVRAHTTIATDLALQALCTPGASFMTLATQPYHGQVHEFMKRENDSGGITRQEAVSMVPPLFLDVQPHHRVGGRPPPTA